MPGHKLYLSIPTFIQIESTATVWLNHKHTNFRIDNIIRILLQSNFFDLCNILNLDAQIYFVCSLEYYAGRTPVSLDKWCRREHKSCRYTANGLFTINLDITPNGAKAKSNSGLSPD